VAPALSAELSAAIVSDESGLEELRDDWTRLALVTGPRAVFRTFEWQWTWWTHYGTRGALRIVVVRQAGAVVGILPFQLVELSVAGIVVRVLRFLGVGSDTAPDYLGGLYAAAHASVIVDCALRALHEQRDWDGIELNELDAEDELRLSGPMVLRSLGVRNAVRIGARISAIELQATIEHNLHQLSRGLRHTLRTSRKKFEALPGAQFRLSDYRSFDTDYDALAALHRERSRSLGVKRAFESDGFVEFNRRIMRSFLERGWLRLGVLEANGETVAALVCFAFGDVWFHFQGGFSGAYARFNPGALAMGYVIGAAISERAREVDLLRGDYAHKRRWESFSRETSVLVAWRSSARGMLWSWRAWYRPRLATWLRGRALARCHSISR
jgi:CelD/BcsL family acetyltransferase involved in cellulose biosynthesis